MTVERENLKARVRDLVSQGMKVVDVCAALGLRIGQLYRLFTANELESFRPVKWHWTSAENEILRRSKTSAVRGLAQSMGVSYFAAYRQRERLRNCSKAKRKAKG
jgi:hypothetical protein